jgi:hypothetical protein
VPSRFQVTTPGWHDERYRAFVPRALGPARPTACTVCRSPRGSTPSSPPGRDSRPRVLADAALCRHGLALAHPHLLPQMECSEFRTPPCKRRVNI